MLRDQIQRSNESALEQVRGVASKVTSEIRVRNLAADVINLAYQYQFEIEDRGEPRQKLLALIEELAEQDSSAS